MMVTAMVNVCRLGLQPRHIATLFDRVFDDDEAAHSMSVCCFSACVDTGM
jgi:hypothetical protein